MTARGFTALGIAILAFAILSVIATATRPGTKASVTVAPLFTPTLFDYLPMIFKEKNTPTFTPEPTSTEVPSSTPTSTNTPIGSPVPPEPPKLTFIEYDPPGDDLQGEFVRIRNDAAIAYDLIDWTLGNQANDVFTFPPFTLQPQASVQIWTKAGANTQTDLFWGRDQAVWNNSGDTATLTERFGHTIDVCTYVGGGQNTGC